ncbi:kinase-like domain-containing protein [Lasiosphaeris hirsuta]|uniref:non-specific serine/threonine protein kinase n=1 Tax=Lasiosphaeris hirsuta TaxID=260670 RepID=A0AA39ZP74_9PEZI|nr:kinase-like domain-containing protein [Lasiosphaeris hirsuta]KAK0729958.1 kinase-like domain-containing protein [Lasiosphaeris hirsuta]
MAESDKYDVLEKIGHGSFGIIRRVRRKVDGMILCRKEISYLKMSQKEREQLHAEFQILSTLRHPNIVGYYHREHLKATQDLHLYMEYCGNGDLGRVIRDLAQKNQYAEESFVWSTFSQLVTALYRCHYGVDPPEVGKTVLGLGAAAKPKAPTGGMTILHRDLKPENVFLGEDNSVKLGDFGLSKMIQSHDFASTYVGTPFYMSPEICAAEKYTLKSDIWSLGCIIYELCSREPPFNAKSHFQLVQKIKEGKIAPLPPIYSPELMAVIKDCLRVNPDRRPDTASLLNLPVVRLMRKEKEVVEFSKMLRLKEDALNKRIRELDQKLTSVDNDKVAMRQEIDASLRREWEVKARLEIDRLVGHEIEALQRKFEAEVQSRVEAELSQRKTVAFGEGEPQELSSSKSDYPHSSIGCGSPDGEFSSATDITEVSVDSPDTSAYVLKKSARTPFVRAQTMFVGPPAGTPMDIEMGSPSPITIASLSLSPRRNAGSKAPVTNPSNIFAANQMAGTEAQWEAPRDHPDLGFDSESDDEVNMPSPTRNIRSAKNPFTTKQRPMLHAQKSAPVPRLQSKQTFAPQAKTVGSLQPNPSNSDLQSIRRVGSNNALREPSDSPTRRLTRIPSAANLNANKSSSGSGSDSSAPPTLTRKASFTNKKESEPQSQPPALNKVAGKTNIRGRTLVELQQARAGGRPLSGEANVSPTRAFREHTTAANRGGLASEPPAVWDPERDEMPSPFLVRRKPIMRV